MPEIGIEWFLNQWDINWNDSMEEWLVAGSTLLENLWSNLVDLPTTVSDQVYK